MAIFNDFTDVLMMVMNSASNLKKKVDTLYYTNIYAAFLI